MALKHIVFDHDGTLVDTSKAPSLFKGMHKLLQDLKEQGIKIYVWTARDRHSTVEILKSLDIIALFEDISCGNDCATKPSPEGLESMLFGVDKDKIAVIGDSPSDIAGAKNFGVLGIAAFWCYEGVNHAERFLKNIEADHTCRTVEECRELIFKLI